MEIKQHLLEQPMGQRRQSKRKLKKKILRQRWKLNISNVHNAAKRVLRGKIIVIKTYIKKKERSQAPGWLNRLSI